MLFTLPPKGVIGNPINLNNVDMLSYTRYAKTNTINYEKCQRARSSIYASVSLDEPISGIQVKRNALKIEDFSQEWVTEASIVFTCSSGTYKWTLPQDTINSLEVIYNSLLNGTYVTKSLQPVSEMT